MKMRSILMVVSLLPASALACGPRDASVLSCTTTEGKFIEVCQTPTDVTYTFGKKGRTPEMTLSVPTQKLDWSSDGGSGADEDTITFHNGNVSYVLNVVNEFGKDFGDGEVVKPSTSATLEVLNSGKTLATIQCKEEGLRDQLENLKTTPRRD